MLDEQFYSQLKHRHTAYPNTTPFQILEHLDTTWCPLDVQAKKKLNDAYFAPWDSHEHPVCHGRGGSIIIINASCEITFIILM